MSDFRINVLNRSFYSDPQRGKQRYLSHHFQRAVKSEHPVDLRICEEANNVLHWNTEVDSSEIKITVQDGTVVLDGFVDSRHAMQLAGKLIENINGVVEVLNRLAVKDRLDLESDKFVTRGDDGLYTEESHPR